MIELKVRREQNPHFDQHSHDIQRICWVLAGRGYLIDRLDAYEAWCRHSDAASAGWLYLPDDDDELAEGVLSQCDEYHV